MTGGGPETPGRGETKRRREVRDVLGMFWLLPYERDQTNKMDDGISSLNRFFEGWKGEVREHIDSTLGSG